MAGNKSIYCAGTWTVPSEGLFGNLRWQALYNHRIPGDLPDQVEDLGQAGGEVGHCDQCAVQARGGSVHGRCSAVELDVLAVALVQDPQVSLLE